MTAHIRAAQFTLYASIDGVHYRRGRGRETLLVMYGHVAEVRTAEGMSRFVQCDGGEIKDTVAPLAQHAVVHPREFVVVIAFLDGYVRTTIVVEIGVDPGKCKVDAQDAITATGFGAAACNNIPERLGQEAAMTSEQAA